MRKSILEMGQWELEEEARQLLMTHLENAELALRDNIYGYSDAELKLLSDAARQQENRVRKLFGYETRNKEGVAHWTKHGRQKRVHQAIAIA